MTEAGLSHAEVWDDSYLQDSWNDAVEEYKKYHSLAARGLDGPALIEELKRTGDITEEQVEERLNGHFEDDVNDDYDPGDIPEAHHKSSTEQPHDNHSGEKRETHPTPSAGVAQHLSGLVPDDGLRNLMMSWYYAGYYTGLHEGAQRARTEARTADQTTIPARAPS